MDRSFLPLNALRAFEAAARHLSITRAAHELCVSQSAVSHQVAQLEQRLGVRLFRRLSRGIALTDEGAALVPVVATAFDQIGATLDQYSSGHFREVLTVAAVGTFVVGWLLERVGSFASAHPEVDLRVMTNNNLVDLAAEGFDLAIRYGDGSWHGVHAEAIMAAPLSPLCSPALGQKLTVPADLNGFPLLRSYRTEEWQRWFAVAGVACPRLQGPILDSSLAMVAAAERGYGVALAPPAMFSSELRTGRLVQPFGAEVDCGRYWLARLNNRRDNDAMAAFRHWLLNTAASELD